MKKITVVLILTAMVFALFSCGEPESPPAYLPSIRYDGTVLQSLTLLEQWGEGPADGCGPAWGKAPEELITSEAENITYTPVGQGKIELVNGSDKNAEFSVSFVGVYTANGEKTEYDEDDFSSIPSGKYVICARMTKVTYPEKERRDEIYYMFAGIEKR